MGDPEETFRRVYADNFDPVIAYALRRVDVPADAADVVAETFLVVWRRLGELPPPDEVRPWVFGIARRTLANQRRGALRRTQLADRLRSRLATAGGIDALADVPADLDARDCLRRLGDRAREVLTLSCWEGLEPRDIAVVLDLPTATVRSRLTRARAAVRRMLLDTADGESPHEFVPSGHVNDRTLELNRKDR